MRQIARMPVRVLSIATFLGFCFLTSIPAHATPVSAKHILSDNPSATDGIYWIDPDGTGGNTQFQIVADMTTAGGGWTLGLASFRDDLASTSDMVANTGTVGLNSSHTRDLSLLALNTDSQIRHRIMNGGQVVFDGYYTGDYHGVLGIASAWTVLVGNVVDIFSYHLGLDWSTATNDVDDDSGNCAIDYGTPWYYSSCWASHPAAQGRSAPHASTHGYVDSWHIWVREGAEYGVPSPTPMVLLGVGLIGIGFLRHRAMANR